MKVRKLGRACLTLGLLTCMTLLPLQSLAIAQSTNGRLVVTVKDEIVVGLNDAELKEMGGDAAGIAKTLA